jgi:hypothetical protein
MFALMRDEVTGGCRKLHNEDLRDLYSLPIGINEQVEVEETGGAFRTNGDSRKACVISGKAGRKETTRKTKT